ncbi:MAG: peptide chain release factor 1 [Candidatus Aenigmarchaeota archaeon]|nr:peptide chain release factor 1 [Candidatus Aenigmarchaeota archaeon]
MVDEGIYKLRVLLKELSTLRGRHTELVSLYVPAGSSLNDTMNLLSNEISLTQNVKSKEVRKNVISALTKVVQHLKLYKQNPPNGLVVFCGNVSEHEGVTDIKIWAIEPPEPVKVKLYWCDQVFKLEPMENMVEEKEVYGLLVMDNQECTVGVLKGKSIRVLKRFDSIVPSKVGKGGQSQARFERVRQGLINDWYKIVAERARDLIPADCKGILLGGPGPAKQTLYEEDYFKTEFRNKIITMQDLGNTDESGLEELVQRSQEALAEASIAKEKALLQKFFQELGKDSGMVSYGLEAVKKAVEDGAANTVLISEGFSWDEAEFACSCGNSFKTLLKTDSKGKCTSCGKEIERIGSRPGIEFFEDLAKSFGTKLEIISTETSEGQKLLAIGGIGALLRYKQ